MALAEQVGLFLPSSLLRFEPLQRRRSRRRLIGHLHDHMLPSDWSKQQTHSLVCILKEKTTVKDVRQVSSPGEVKGQLDLQWSPLEAVFGAHRKPRCLSIRAH